MYSQVTVVGNLGRDPEMRYTPSGQAVTNINVASNRTWTNADGEKVKETTWWRVSIWGKMAEACNTYLKKGSKVLVVGRMNSDPQTGGPRLWTRQDGSSAANYEITAQTVQFLSSKGEGGGEAPEAGGDFEGTPTESDDIPF
jgi:single-strand DNA-binding protein